MLAFREQGVLVVLVLHSAHHQSGGDLYRAKTLRMSAELVFSYGHKPALRYSLISPWTTCLRLIRAVISIRWPGSCNGSRCSRDWWGRCSL
jgi:hypothetical protein